MMIKQRTGDLGEEGADAVHVKGHGEGRLFVKKKNVFWKCGGGIKWYGLVFVAGAMCVIVVVWCCR